MKKQIITGLLSTILIAGAAFAAGSAGFVYFVNNGSKAGTTDAVQYKVVTQPSQGVAYTEVLAAAEGKNETHLTSGALGTSTTSFNVYIEDSSTGNPTYHECLNDVTYSASWAPQYIFGWYNHTTGKYECALGNS